MPIHPTIRNNPLPDTSRFGWRPRAVQTLLVCALFAGNTSDADQPAAEDTTARLNRLEQLTAGIDADRARLAAELAAVVARLAALEPLAAASQPVPPGVDATQRPPDDPSAGAPPAGNRVPAGQPAIGDQDGSPATAQATEQRLNLLIEQFAIAQQLRQEAVAQLAGARTQLGELRARQTQAQLELQEAQARADKAERRYTALEEAQDRVMTERERLGSELEATQARLAESLKQSVALDARLAVTEARVVQLENEANVRTVGTNDAPARSGSPTPAPAAETPARDIAAPGGDATPDAQAPAVYVVRAADTLSKISAKVYGDPADWPRIFEANRAALGTPDQLAPGMSLVIP